MKKFLLLLFLIISLTVSAQTSVRFGIKGGGNLSFVKETSIISLIPPGFYSELPTENLITIPGVLNGKHGFGYWGGAFLEISPNTSSNKFKLQAEILYSQHSVNLNSSFHTDTTQYAGKDHLALQQISVPLLAEYFIIPSLSLNAGPTFNYNLKEKRTSQSLLLSSSSYLPSITESSFMSNVKSFQLGLAAGAAYYFYKGLFIDARYNPLFGKKGNYGIQDKIQSVQLGVGYKF
jgi:opacity protein-like surface antigen